MLRVLVLLTAVCSVLAEDGFAKKYAYSKVMTNCFGEDLYYGWSKEVFKAVKECYGEEMNLPKADEEEAAEEENDMSPIDFDRFSGQPIVLFYPPQAQGQAQRLPFNFPFKAFSQRQKREAMYDAPLLKKMVQKVKAKASNFTCVMRKMNYIDDDFNIDYKKSAEETKELDISEDLKEDLLEAMHKCKKLTMCLPLERSPMPVKLQRIVAMTKCMKKARLGVCMKHDLMRYLQEFDLSAFPAMEDADEESKAEKLMLILWGVEAKDDFQLY
ncbi:uncharacterized protein LOC122263543 [Penaeus japonicus]|uniref:uncharacterized protein LOC122263543 n=1 Tax=Penaeus japonicus TaxID=27405 RepID=UPI001C7145E9|nr:uncharacterized protein LOC122263543 [Penaeus japonicus]